VRAPPSPFPSLPLEKEAWKKWIVKKEKNVEMSHDTGVNGRPFQFPSPPLRRASGISLRARCGRTGRCAHARERASERNLAALIKGYTGLNSFASARAALFIQIRNYSRKASPCAAEYTPLVRVLAYAKRERADAGTFFGAPLGENANDGPASVILHPSTTG